MISPAKHWGTRDWQQNQDLLALDREHPLAFPGRCPADLMGRIRVYLTAEGGNLVAYGFGGQRVALPSKSVGAVQTVTAYRTGLAARGKALLILDHGNRIMLRAAGLWQTYGEVAAVCRAARVPAPSHLTPSQVTRSAGRSGRSRSTRAVPRLEKAPGYRRLRTRPRGATLRVLGLALLLALATGLGTCLGAAPAVALPQWLGAVRTLAGIVGGLCGAAAGLWAGAGIAHLLADLVRWLTTSWAVGTPAPARRFFRRRAPARAWPVAANVGLAALVAALVGWGPGVGTASLAHGLRDSALVAGLRANGVEAPGTLIDVQQFSTDENGETTVTDVPTLSFLGWQATDPSIGGRPLPLDASDPTGTSVPETVVFLPLDPHTAAAKQQIAGSVWHGAPTANLISAGLFTLALPPLLWLLVLRIRRRRWLQAKDLVGDLRS